MTVVSVGEPKDGSARSEVEGTRNAEEPENPRTESVERAWFDEAVELLGLPAAVLDHLHCILAANSRFCDLSRTGRASIINRHLRDVGNGIFYTPEVQEALAFLKSSGSSEGEHRKRIDLPLVGGRTLVATIRPLPATFRIARALLVVDLPGEHPLGRKGPRALMHSAPADPLGPLSADTLRHDIRQPLQTLFLLQGALSMREDDPIRKNYLAQLQQAIEALGGMLDVLEELQRPNAGPAAPRFAGFPVALVLDRLRSEFTYHVEARGLKLSVIPSRAVVHSDSRLLEQVVRALLLAATKMLSSGKILLGCRRRGGKLSMEIWSGGEAIPSRQQQEILDEFHPSSPLPDEKGIVRSIVEPHSDVLGLSVKARSRPGTGLLFTTDVPMSPISQWDLAHDPQVEGIGEVAARGAAAIVSDNPSNREALTLLLQDAGYQVVSVRDDAGEVEIEASGDIQPEVIVADFDRPADSAAKRLIGELRNLLGPHTPAVVIADESWRAAQSGPISDPVTYLSKPATAKEITTRVSQALVAARGRQAVPRVKHRRSPQQTTFIVDDDHLLRDAMSAVLRARGEHVEVHSSAESFLESYRSRRRGCLVVDDKLPGIRGLELLERLKTEGATLPAIMITGHGDIATAVRAMRTGAIDYIEKPVHHGRLLSAIDYALEIDRKSADILARRQELAARFATLTQRERQIMDFVAKGASSKAIAHTLSISQRTVENHRAAVMKRMGATSLSDLVRAVMELRHSQEQ